MAAAVLSFIWALWPLLLLAGGLALAPLNGVGALLTLPGSVRRIRPGAYFIVLFAFFAYATASSIWSPFDAGIIDIDLAKGDFNLRAPTLRVGLQIVAIGALIAAALGLSRASRQLVVTLSTAALFLQFVMVLILAADSDWVLDFFAPYMADRGEGVQNIGRNALLMALAAPFLVLSLEDVKPRWAALLAGALILLGEAWALWRLDTMAGLLAMACAGLSIGVLRLFPRYGFRILSMLVALVLMGAPLVFGIISQNADATLATNSLEWRQAIWRRVSEIIADHPVFGAGLGVLRAERATIDSGMFAGQILVPNHAHNMTLQLWAETGVIGASLLTLSLMLAAWRLPPPGAFGPSGRRIAGLVGGVIAISMVSFDLWNEWWWAATGLLAVLATLHAPLQQSRLTQSFSA
jgi:O-antigen ligase